ncbi:MAG TPA: hypothetical protein VK658_29000 [Chryseolinea sp.]|nr:hypothetical protein [Chryseolinea sp.]
MKTKWYLVIALPIACLLLASFITLPGGDSFEVYLDNDLLLKEHVYGQRASQPINLDKNSGTTLTVSFSHCGVTGTSRSLSLRDGEKNLLKEWKFADVDPKIKDPMAMPVKEVVAASAGHHATLYYKSNEIENAVMLAPVKLIDKSTVSK